MRQDRGAALRVCPVFATTEPEEIARQFNFEFRVCDAAASPYMALGAVLFAGADGLRRKLALPGRRRPAGIAALVGEALNAMEASDAVRGWFGPVFMDAYVRHKRSELAYTQEFAVTELCQRYAEIY